MVALQFGSPGEIGVILRITLVTELDLNGRPPRVVPSHHVLQLLGRLERHPCLVRQLAPSILMPIFAIRIQRVLEVAQVDVGVSFCITPIPCASEAKTP
jgi:hypothetical protein